MKAPIYLDYNASAPLLDCARDAIITALDVTGNPSSVHASGRKLKAMVQKARRQVAALVNAKPDHVVFTSGATEAANLVLTPKFSMGRSALAIGHLYVCASDHPATREGGRFQKEQITQLPVTSDGLMKLDALDDALAAHDKASGLPMLAYALVNNETGVVQDASAISAIAKKHGAIVVVDAVQGAGRLNIDITDNYADYLILSSHKIGGPKGAGALVALSDLMMPMPLIRGGGQERGHRSGTESVSAIAGFGAAADHAREHLAEFADIADKRDQMERALEDIGATIYGRQATRVANTCYFSLVGVKAETAQIALDLAGIAVSPGSACSSGKVGRSHVLDAMGVDCPQGALRVSIGQDISTDDIAAFLTEIRKIAGRTAQ